MNSPPISAGVFAGSFAGARPAVIDRDGSLTYDELETRVARVAGGLRARGVRPGDAVLIVTANDCASVVAYHAVVRCGATAVLSQHSAGESELRAATDATAPALTLTGAAIADLDGDPVAASGDDRDRPRVVVFTSGTTSVPKGVVHTARSLSATIANVAAMTGFGADDRAFLVSPLASITGVTQALEVAPAVGAAVVLESAYDDERSLDLLLETGGTFYGGPDLVLDRLLQAAARRGVAVPLQAAALGGTMLRRELLDTAERAGVRVIRVYGSSEVPWSTGTRVGDPAELRLADEGMPGPGVELRLSEDGTNELLIRGPHVFAGYVGALRDARSTSSSGTQDGGDWFATGDEAEIVGGRLRIVGRLKDVASRNGKKVSLAEVDAAFAAASGVRDCAAFTVADDATGERVAVAVRHDGDLDVPAVLAAMEAAGLARFKLPERVVRWEGALPVTATGKVQRRELSEDAPLLWQAERLRP